MSVKYLHRQEVQSSVPRIHVKSQVWWRSGNLSAREGKAGDPWSSLTTRPVWTKSVSLRFQCESQPQTQSGQCLRKDA